MRRMLLIGFIALTAASATASASDGYDNPTHWQGYVMRNGLRTAITVDLSQSDGQWGGQLSAGGNEVALDQVRLTTTKVHFAAPGEGVFDGEVAGDEMAGGISGSAGGSFALTREDANDYSPYFLGP